MASFVLNKSCVFSFINSFWALVLTLMPIVFYYFVCDISCKNKISENKKLIYFSMVKNKKEEIMSQFITERNTFQ